MADSVTTATTPHLPEPFPRSVQRPSPAPTVTDGRLPTPAEVMCAGGPLTGMRVGEGRLATAASPSGFPTNPAWAAAGPGCRAGLGIGQASHQAELVAGDTVCAHDQVLTVQTDRAGGGSFREVWDGLSHRNDQRWPTMRCVCLLGRCQDQA